MWLKDERFRLFLFPCLLMLFLVIIVADNLHLFSGEKNSVIYTYTQSVLNGELASGYGPAVSTDISVFEIESGDIVLGGWPNCAYGRYSHAGIYLGDNEVLEAYVDYGITIQPLSHYTNYSQFCLLHVNADKEIKNKAVEYARAQKDKMFYIVSFKKDSRYWNCSKLIWKAYAEQGIDLDVNNDLWIAPESFVFSPYVDKVCERGI